MTMKERWRIVRRVAWTLTHGGLGSARTCLRSEKAAARKAAKRKAKKVMKRT